MQPLPRARTPGAIVYLAQKRHSSYGRDSIGLLTRSLRLLFENYNDAYAFGPLNCSERLALPPAPPAVKQAVLEAVPWAAATQHTPSKTRRLLACDPLGPVLAEVEREVEREWTRRAAWLREED